MDNTKKYILQCKKAKKIQENWQPNILDIFHYANGISHVTVEDFYKFVKNRGVYFKRQKTWLPRQDQLQILSKLSWQEFDWKCANEYPLAITKEQAGLKVVLKQLDKTTQ